MYNKNASEPMWFRGVAASMGLCLDLSAILEGHPDVVLAVDGDVMLLFKAWFPPEFKGFVKPGISAKTIGLIIKDSVFIDPASKSGMILYKTEKT